MSDEKEYDVAVYKLTYYKADPETGDALYDENFKVIEFYLPNEDYSYMAEGVDIDDLVEVKQ